MSTEAPCVEIKDKRTTYVRCGFEQRKQPAQLTFFPISLSPPTVDCCIPEEEGSIACGSWQTGWHDDPSKSLKISGKAACGVGPNYVAVRGNMPLELYIACEIWKEIQIQTEEER